MPPTPDCSLNVLVVDSHEIYRRGLSDCLRTLHEVDGVREVCGVVEARDELALAAADVVILDDELPGSRDFVRDGGVARVLVFLSRNEGDVLDAVAAGAAGVLCKDTLTPDGLAAAVRAAINGNSVIAPELLGELVDERSRPAARTHEANGHGVTWLTTREQQVLGLIAEGHPTREVAQRLCYSERTVKNVLHDVVVKLGARSRSQAVANAVRDGLI